MTSETPTTKPVIPLPRQRAGYALLSLLLGFSIFNFESINWIFAILVAGVCAFLVRPGEAKLTSEKLLHYAIKMESKYELDKALEAYDLVSEQFPDSKEAADARICADIIRKRLISN